MDWIAGFLEKYPELAVFLAIALGYLVGGVKFGEFSFGPVTGSLLAGLAIGQFAHVPVSPMAKAFLFLLFLFGVFEQLVNNDMGKQVLGYIGIWNHIDEFASGIVDTRRLVFYLSGTLFFLFLASRALEDKKWR